MDDVVSKFVRKSKVLYSEALDDLERGNFNKAVSGFYFSVEALANAIVYKYRQRVRGFMGRVNIISKLVSKDVGKKMLYLYELRVLADHKETLLVESDAREAEKIANYLINELRKSLSEFSH